jgi:hypothetical protein
MVTDVSNSYVACSGGAECTFRADLNLPAGALLTSIEADICDNDAGNNVVVELFKVPAIPAGPQAYSVLATAASSGTPGCALVAANLPTPEVIGNRTQGYYFRSSQGLTTNTRLYGVRALYALQVSPAPVVATFPNDVPTSHPYFRFIEALAAAGITSGCGPGSFCPNLPITRGEMAVFLAAALGLHFAP